MSVTMLAAARRTSTQRHGARAVFIDKDGTLVHDVPYNVDPARISFTPGALEGLRLLSLAGFLLVVVTNQPGVGLGYYDMGALRRLRMALERMLADAGIALAGFHACPHAPASLAFPAGRGCNCRKPAPGMLYAAARLHGLDLSHSWMVGDILDDVEAGHLAGCRSVLLDVGNETMWNMSQVRTPDFRAADLLEAAREIVAREGGMPLRDRQARVDPANATGP